jgi:hypothetical protein
MNEVRMLLIVVVLSVLIFVFISLVLGDSLAGSKDCGPGSAYNEYTGKCKDLVTSNKR